jgi:hypothetical protein
MDLSSSQPKPAVPANAETHGSIIAPLAWSVPASAGTAAKLFVGAFPTGVGDVEDDTVRSGPFHLEIGMAAARHRRIHPVLRGEALCMRPLELVAGLVEIIDLKAEMVDAGEMRTVRPLSADVSPLVLSIARLMWPSDRNTAPFALRRNSLRPKADL